MKQPKITGAWEMMPEHGNKPNAVLEAERKERELETARKHLKKLQAEHDALAGAAACRIWDVFGMDAAKTLHLSGTHSWLFDRMLDTASIEGKLRTNK